MTTRSRQGLEQIVPGSVWGMAVLDDVIVYGDHGESAGDPSADGGLNLRHREVESGAAAARDGDEGEAQAESESGGAARAAGADVRDRATFVALGRVEAVLAALAGAVLGLVAEGRAVRRP